jgi:N-acetylmuramoyl-L-alanine amidase
MNEPIDFTPQFDEHVPLNDADSVTPGQRVKMQQQKRNQFSVFGSLQTVFIYAFLIASLFTLFTPNNLFSGQSLNRMFQAWQANPSNVAQPVINPVINPTGRIGIVAGHWKNDSGSVCSNGLKEVDVNLTIASLVQQKLAQEGYQVDLLEEFDSRLSQYQAMAVISIHSDSCDFISTDATGFKVAAALESAFPEKTDRLSGCLIDRYAATTGLTYRAGNTNDMTYYHAFSEVNTETPAVIIEVGFLNLDQQILTQQPDLIANGIVNGLLCYIRNESIVPTVIP